MTSLYPHPPYAEDQPHAHQILYLHTARAGAMTGSFVSLITATTHTLLPSSRQQRPAPFASRLATHVLTHAPRGLVGGTLFGVAATYARMRGREEIEWRDRSWRLLGNEGEVATDWVVLGGAGLGGVFGARAWKGARGVVAGVGVGVAGGVVYMVGRMAGRGRE